MPWCVDMAGHSFFVEPGAIREGQVELGVAAAHQIRNVLRLQPGDSIDVLDGSGFVLVARLVHLAKAGAAAEVMERHPLDTEPGVELDLYQALLKGQKMELVLQKCTEIGVCRFIPVISERCISRPDGAELEGKLDRWRAVVREAAEQSRRAVLPAVARPLPFMEACRAASQADLAVLAWEQEHGVGLRPLVRDAVTRRREGAKRGDSHLRAFASSRDHIALLIGPEGGFSPAEARQATDAAVRVASLGPRILRAETAALVAATLVLCETGDLGG